MGLSPFFVSKGLCLNFFEGFSTPVDMPQKANFQSQLTAGSDALRQALSTDRNPKSGQGGLARRLRRYTLILNDDSKRHESFGQGACVIGRAVGNHREVLSPVKLSVFFECSRTSYAFYPVEKVPHEP